MKKVYSVGLLVAVAVVSLCGLAFALDDVAIPDDIYDGSARKVQVDAIDVRLTAAEADVAAIEAGTATVRLDTGKIWIGNGVSNQSQVAVSGAISIGTNGAVTAVAIPHTTITGGVSTNISVLIAGGGTSVVTIANGVITSTVTQ